MIKINLLPLEKRRTERTPMPRFILIVANVAAAALLVLYGGLAFIRNGMLDSEKKELTEQLQKLSDDVKTHDEYTQKMASRKAELEQIDQIAKRQVDMWRILDALWKTVDDNKKIWLEQIRFLDSEAAKGFFKKSNPTARDFPPYALEITCRAAGSDPRVMTRFRTDLKANAQLRKYFQHCNVNPDFVVEPDRDKAYKNKHLLSFKVSIFPTPVVTTPQKAPPKPPAAGAAK